MDKEINRLLHDLAAKKPYHDPREIAPLFTQKTGLKFTTKLARIFTQAQEDHRIR